MRASFPLLLLLLVSPVVVFAANLQQEYIQVRKIALRDPKVQEAFEKANERLNQRILEIDPSLAPIVNKEQRSPAQQPFETPQHREVWRTAPPANSEIHVVVKGETLSSIAAHYHVTVAELKTRNQITDERKLKIGQKLVIPSAATPSVTAPAAAPSPTPQDDNILDRLKKDL